MEPWKRGNGGIKPGFPSYNLLSPCVLKQTRTRFKKDFILKNQQGKNQLHCNFQGLGSLQDNQLLVIKYFVTKSLNFADKYFVQQKIFRIIFIVLDVLLKIFQRNLNFHYREYVPKKFKFVLKGFPPTNYFISENDYYHH